MVHKAPGPESHVLSLEHLRQVKQLLEARRYPSGARVTNPIVLSVFRWVVRYGTWRGRQIHVLANHLQGYPSVEAFFDANQRQLDAQRGVNAAARLRVLKRERA